MKLANVKAMVAKVTAVGFLAGLFIMAAPMKAQAQAFAFGVEVGHPHHDIYRRDRFDHIRAEEFRRREEFVRHQEWVRAHEFSGYRYGAPYRFR